MIIDVKMHIRSLSILLYLYISHTYAEIQTTSNKAYNVVGGKTSSGRVGESEYEIPQDPPGLTFSSKPATAAINQCKL